MTHTVSGRLEYRQVAVSKEDAVVGYAVSVHETWDPEGQFYAWAGVAPSCRGRGIGSSLYSDMLRFLERHNAGTISSEVRDNCPVSQSFVNRRGFEKDRHQFQSNLDLETFDESPYRHILAEVSETGIRIHSLADFGDTLDARRKLYEVNAITDEDVPGWTGPGLSFEEFNEWVYESSWYRPDGQLVAADGDHWVGICAVRFYLEAKRAYNVHTGIIRDYRRRHIALALKLAAIRYARKHNIRTLTTGNDSLNAPMLALNQKLGYVPVPGRYTLCRTIT